MGPRRVGAQNFALFSRSRHNLNSFFLLVGVFSWNSGVLKRQALKCARLEFSGCRVAPLRLTFLWVGRSLSPPLPHQGKESVLTSFQTNQLRPPAVDFLAIPSCGSSPVKSPDESNWPKPEFLRPAHTEQLERQNRCGASKHPEPTKKTHED